MCATMRHKQLQATTAKVQCTVHHKQRAAKHMQRTVKQKIWGENGMSVVLVPSPHW